jgi:hypothetical protein
MLSASKAEGEAIGEARGLEKGLEKAVINGKNAGCSIELIAAITGLTTGQITEILQRHGLQL